MESLGYVVKRKPSLRFHYFIKEDEKLLHAMKNIKNLVCHLPNDEKILFFITLQRKKYLLNYYSIMQVIIKNLI